jgi:hypothetical protein
MRERMALLGFDPVGSTPDEYSAATAANIPKFSRLLRDAGIKAE